MNSEVIKLGNGDFVVINPILKVPATLKGREELFPLFVGGKKKRGNNEGKDDEGLGKILEKESL